jgi:hypothetical protein
MGERVLIYGSRTWRDPEPIRAFVATLPANAVVIHGAQRSHDRETGESYGADYFADVAAKERGLAVEPYPAAWLEHVNCRCRSHRGRCLGAGPRRNQQMVEANPTSARGFRMPGESRGTDDMTRRLRRAGIPTEVVGEQWSAAGG